LLLTCQRFNFLCWNAGIKIARFTVHIFKYHCTGGDNNIRFDNSTIHYNGTHPDQDVIMDHTTVNDSIMPNIDVASNICTISLIGTMYGDIVLYIGIIANFNVIHIATNNSIKPNGTMRTDLYIAD